MTRAVILIIVTCYFAGFKSSNKSISIPEVSNQNIPKSERLDSNGNTIQIHKSYMIKEPQQHREKSVSSLENGATAPWNMMR